MDGTRSSTTTLSEKDSVSQTSSHFSASSLSYLAADAVVARPAAGESIYHPAPDGGRQAWLVVLGTSLAFFSSWGVLNAYGAFQAYYSTGLLKSAPTSTITLIGSMQLFVIYGVGPLVGKITDAYGVAVVMPLGSSLVVLSLLLLSFCQQDQVYQVFLTHGVLFGLGSACVFTPSFTCVGQHFSSRRSYALSIAGAAASLGGMLFPIILQQLITKIGFPWAVRTIALCTIPCLATSCLTVKTWLPPSRDLSLRSAVDFRGFRSLNYALAAVGSFLVFLVIFIPFFFINTYGYAHGVQPEISGYLVTIINAFTIPARIIPGLLADYFGVLPVLVPSILMTGVLVLGMWTFSTGAAAIFAFACLYGLLSGSFTVLLPSYIAQIVPRESFGARLGSVYMAAAIANLIGPTVAGSFFADSSVISQSEFNRLIIFTGLSMSGGGVFFGAAHLLDVRRSSSSKVDAAHTDSDSEKSARTM